MSFMEFIFLTAAADLRWSFLEAGFMSEMVCPRSLRIGRGEPLSSPSAEQVTPPLAEEMLLLLPPLVWVQWWVRSVEGWPSNVNCFPLSILIWASKRSLLTYCFPFNLLYAVFVKELHCIFPLCGLGCNLPSGVLRCGAPWRSPRVEVARWILCCRPSQTQIWSTKDKWVLPAYKSLYFEAPKLCHYLFRVLCSAFVYFESKFTNIKKITIKRHTTFHLNKLLYVLKYNWILSFWQKIQSFYLYFFLPHLGESLALPKGGGEGDISGRGETGVGDAGGLYSPGGEDSSPPTTAPSLISGLEWHRWTGTRGSSKLSPASGWVCISTVVCANRNIL